MWAAVEITEVTDLIVHNEVENVPEPGNVDEPVAAENIKENVTKEGDDKVEEVEKEEMEALKSLLELKELTVQDILIPMNEVISVNIDAIEDFENIDRNKFYPVTSSENGDYIGFIHSKEIEQLEEFQSSAQDFLIEPYYVPESTQLFSQLKILARLQTF